MVIEVALICLPGFKMKLCSLTVMGSKARIEVAVRLCLDCLVTGALN